MAQDDTAAAKRLSFNGYHNRPLQGDDLLLTHVGPGTACGECEYMRRYWHPFLSMATREVGEFIFLCAQST